MIGVVDSSVAVKWYAAEPDSDLATALLGEPLVAPDLIRAEVANALWKKVRRGEMVREQTMAALPHLSAAVTLLPAEALAETALAIALDLGHPVYDCFFLAMAQELSLPLITADTRLCARLEGTLLQKGVVMLSSWQNGNG